VQVNAALAGIRRRTHGESARPDSIFNGADDDGTGSMAVLEIAERLATDRQHLKRSVIFVWHVGEEAGLLGSQWFTDHPTVPRESIVPAQHRHDRPRRRHRRHRDHQGLGQIHGDPNYVQVIGSRRVATQLGDMVEAVNLSGHHGLKFDYALDATATDEHLLPQRPLRIRPLRHPDRLLHTGGHATITR